MRTALLALLLLAGQAAACPFCDGGPSGTNEVRERVLDDGFWPRAAVVLAPFPVLAGLVALAYFFPRCDAERDDPCEPPTAGR
ncbi:MAG: hypothetical protein K2W96_12190 [Gemmataceae bacterium]|nr:hypothetical protein [Gemmataceae bacterium]